MTTLAALKAELADDFARPDLGTPIAAAITAAITFYKRKRFYFNEVRNVTITSVASQSDYTSTDNSSIPLFFDIDAIYVSQSGSTPRKMYRIDQDEMEYLIGVGTTGQPRDWTWFNQGFRVFPIPSNTSHTFRMIGAIEKAAPATDAEAANVWMTEAYELLRCRAKKLLYAHVIKDPGEAAVMQDLETQALRDLRAANTFRRGTGTIAATSF